MFQTKALYNLLRINAKEDPSLKVEPWMLEDLRSVSSEELLARLKKADLPLDKALLLQFAQECDSPEELADLLLSEELAPEEQDRLYLLLFELWRRLLPERPSLSIFCDELDEWISQFDTDRLESDEPLQDALANFIDILEEHVDAGMTPHEAYKRISEYAAHDLELFLYDYISSLIDAGNQTYAMELFESLAPALSRSLRFRLLGARLSAEPEESDRLFKEVIEDSHSDSELLFETLRCLTSVGEGDLFSRALRKLFPKMKTEEELQEVMELSAEYYRRLDQDTLEQAILEIKEKRSPQGEMLRLSDPDVHRLKELLCQ